MAPGGAGRTFTALPCVFTVVLVVWSHKRVLKFFNILQVIFSKMKYENMLYSLEIKRLIFSLSESVGLNIYVCDAGGQFVCEPRSGGFTWTDGVSARLWLRYSALFLDAAGLQWLWRGGPCHPWEVRPESRKSLDSIEKIKIILPSHFSTDSEGPSRDVILHLTTGRIHNKNVSTHLIGSISKGENDESFTTILRGQLKFDISQQVQRRNRQRVACLLSVH